MFDLRSLLSAPPPLDAPVARRAGQLITFGAFAERADAWRTAFAEHAGQHFALYFEDSLEFAAALMGVWHAGKAAWLPGDVLPATLSGLAAHIDGYAGDMPADRATVQALKGSTARWPLLDEQAQQLVIFTSGSSGAPVAIAKRLGQLFAEARALQQLFDERVAQAEVLATVSHQHIYGLLFRVLWPLASGRVFHAERLSYIEDIPARAQGPVVLIASPAHLKRLPEAALAPRAVFSSGGPLPDAAVPDCIAKLGQAPIEVYGSSETGGVAWRQRSGLQAWQALPNVQWRLQDETLEVRSPHLPSSSWTATADRAAPDGEGFTLLGRADRVLKIEEKRVSLSAVEQALLATGLLQDLRVLTLPGPREQLAVVAVPNAAGWTLHANQGKAALANALREALRQQIEAVALPRRWRFVSVLPSNTQGKTTVEALRSLFDPRRPQPRVLIATPTSAELSITVDAALPQFDGHFPDHPILPGVAQLEWAILLGRELFALPPRFLALEGLKFQQVIRPGDTVTLTLDFKPEAGKLNFKYSSERGQHAAGRILFGAAEA
ncbi:MAG TPA: AMP-binding protein [Burkholderiaceae bacterium]